MRHHNLARIESLLQQARAACAGRVEWFAEIDSTNDRLMAQPDIHARVCIAELQTAGRGRRGRAWRAPQSGAVLLSIGWRLGGGASGLSLVSGLAIADCLRRAGVVGVGLKWPNDVLVAGKKLGGVLTELRGAFCVVGVGINVARAPDEFASDATDLTALGYALDRDQLAAELIIAHCCYLEKFCEHGFAPFKDEWNNVNVYRDVAVTVASPAEEFCGLARGVDDDGALLVEHSGELRRIISGDVRVREQQAEQETAQ